MSLRNRAVQIVEHLSTNQFRANETVINAIYNDQRIINTPTGDKRVADLPLSVLCIAGAARKGKSFILNFFLNYLIHKEEHPDKPWELNDETVLEGFEFRNKGVPTTSGIWAWNHIFVIEQDDGEKVAVSLIDSQGTFDKKTKNQDDSTIFALTCLFSSIMCFNVVNDLQEDKLSYFATFVDHAKVVAAKLGESGKLFQDLVFIVRDFKDITYLNEKNGGQMYLDETFLSDTEDEEHQQLRDGINDSCERKFCFVLPHPGETVDLETTSKTPDMKPKFVFGSKEMVVTLLSQDVLPVKPPPMHCGDMCGYFLLCVTCCNDNQEFAPKPAHIVYRDFMINLELKRACENYDDLMEKAFVDCEAGYKNDKLLSLHKNAFEQIQDDILNRIKKQDVVAEVIEKFVNQTKKIFLKYKEKNEMLVEIEKKRIEKIEENRRHAEELVRQRELHEQQERERRQRELHEQQERERRQRELHEQQERERHQRELHEQQERERHQRELHEQQGRERRNEILGAVAAGAACVAAVTVMVVAGPVAGPVAGVAIIERILNGGRPNI